MTKAIDKWKKMYDESLTKINKLKYDRDISVLVGSATCENAAGSTKVYETFKKELAGLNNVYLGITGCTGRCSMEPIVQIYKKGYLSIKYANVKEQDVKKIVEEHLKNGKIVLDLVLAEN